jgi:shikimate kinase
MTQNKDLKTHLKKPVVLVGLMGSGKTTLGRALAGALGLEFVDADDVITARAGKDIPTIFAEDGEAVFRAVEREAIAGLLNSAAVRIIATGGGGIYQRPDARAGKGKGVICLDQG